MRTTGIGGVPGVALMYVGIDQILQGSLNMRYGRVGKNHSVIENAVFGATGSETLAVLTPGIFSLGLGWYGSIARAAARGAAVTGLARADGRARHGSARAFAARQVAGLALARAGLVAAEAVGAELGLALRVLLADLADLVLARTAALAMGFAP